MVTPLVQKYKSAYYVYRGSLHGMGCHGVMHEGIVSWHDVKNDALRVCEGVNERYGLPHVNVDKSSTFNLTRNQNVS